jgi:putative tryptophan/tyrosine transport system substrate-binding protein
MSAARGEPAGNAAVRQSRKMTDAVEKARGMSAARNNRIIGADFLNRPFAFDACLESILLGDPPQNLFSTASTHLGSWAANFAVMRNGWQVAKSFRYLLTALHQFDILRCGSGSWGRKQVKRRDFITLLGGAAAWPVAPRAQQPAMPVIGSMNGGSPEPQARQLAAFRQGLGEIGYIEDHNVKIEYRWAESQYDRLSGMAADLVRRQVTVIAATGTPAALAAKAATAIIPIVFETAGDPTRLGLVASLNRPGANIAGVTQLSSELVSKRLGLLHDMIPTATIIGLLVNPNDPRAETQSRDMQEAAHALGLQIHVLNASTEGEIDTAFAGLVRLRAGALLVGTGEFFSRRPNNSWRWRRAMRCLRFISIACSSWPVVSSPTERALPIPIAKPVFTPVGFSKARSPPTCQSCDRPNSSWSST